MSLLNEFLIQGGQLVVPNGAVNAAVRAHFALQQTTQCDVWPSPAVQPLEVWLGTQLNLVQWDGLDPMPWVMSALQERALWARIIEANDFGLSLASGSVASLSQDAWSLLHGWHVGIDTDDQTLPLEQRAFREWSLVFQRECRDLRVMDRARAIAQLEVPKAPSTLRCVGLWDAAPSVKRLLPSSLFTPATASRPAHQYFCYPTIADEVKAALGWAQAQRARAPRAQVVIAYADPAARDAILRAEKNLASQLALTQQRSSSLRGGPGNALPAMLVDVLNLLSLPQEISRAAAARVITSPYLVDAKAEQIARARAAARILDSSAEAIGLNEFISLAQQENVAALDSLWQNLRALRDDTRRASLQTWVTRIERVVQSAGWPGRQFVANAELRAEQGWQRALDDVASLDLVLPAQPFPAAVAQVRDALTAQRWHHEAAPDAIDVLSIAEAAAFAPEYVWVVGFHDAQFPPLLDANPLLAYHALRIARVPSADRQQQLVHATHCMRMLDAYAEACVMSFAAHHGDVIQSACYLAGVMPTLISSPPNAASSELNCFEAVEDAPVPYAAGRTAGGVAVLTDQAACAFRAFARHRLAARAGDAPTLGPSPLERGNLLHRVLAEVWRHFITRNACADAGALGRTYAVARVIDEVYREQAPAIGHTLERRRLQQVVLRWLDYELLRPNFSVTGCEVEKTLELGSLQLQLRIDRIDHLADGSEIMLDYKTGKDVRRTQWDVPRPEQPQLPVYALTSDATAGIAFAKVTAAECKLLDEPEGITTKAGFTPDLVAWQTKREAWRHELIALANAYVAGNAEVAPKSFPETCQRCDLPTLCRIYECDHGFLDDEVDEPE